MKQLGRIFLFGFLMALALAVVSGITQAQANTCEFISAYANGPDNATTPDYYGVAYHTGASFIHSITFDISADSDAFFDFDGAGSFNDATAPVLGTLTGLTAADIISLTYGKFVGGDFSHPALLTFTFAPGSFAPGDSLFFAADTDFFVSDPAPGGVFGEGGAIFSALLESGQLLSTPFVKLTNDFSVAPLSSCSNCNSAVPVPPALYLFGSGLLGLGGLGWTRRRG